MLDSSSGKLIFLSFFGLLAVGIDATVAGSDGDDARSEEVEKEDVSQVVVNKIDYANKSLIKDNKSFASLFKN